MTKHNFHIVISRELYDQAQFSWCHNCRVHLVMHSTVLELAVHCTRVAILSVHTPPQHAHEIYDCMQGPGHMVNPVYMIKYTVDPSLISLRTFPQLLCG